MDIYLLRHGLSTANEQRLVCGAADYPLSQSGLEQAQRVCQQLSGVTFTKIYSSPLSRALQTIAPLEPKVDVTIANELVELDTGEASHLCVDDLWQQEPRYRYQGLNPTLKYPSGECLNDMLQRIGNWYTLTAKEWGKEDVILIAGHEGTVCGILHRLLGLAIEHYPTFLVGNCDHVHIHVNNDGQIRYRFVPLQHLN
jgi:broad specificity phosphatase PhoE